MLSPLHIYFTTIKKLGVKNLKNFPHLLKWCKIFLFYQHTFFKRVTIRLWGGNMDNKLFSSNIIMGLMYIIIGALIAFNPLLTQIVLIYIIGILAIFYGVNLIVRYFRGFDGYISIITDLIMGILLVGSGIYVLFNPVISSLTLPMVAGIYLIVDAIVKVPASYQAYKVIDMPLWIVLITILIPFILGLLLVLAPFNTAMKIVMITGIFFMISGIIDVITTIYIHHQLKKANQIF